MGAHYRSIDVDGIMEVGIRARIAGERNIMNQAFAVLLDAALGGDLRLRITLHTSDPDGYDISAAEQDLIGVEILRNKNRLRAPARLLRQAVSQACYKAIGDDDTFELKNRRGGARAARLSETERRALERRLLQLAGNSIPNIFAEPAFA